MSDVLTMDRQAHALRTAVNALGRYRHCRHAVIDCPCTKEAREALVSAYLLTGMTPPGVKPASDEAAG